MRMRMAAVLVAALVAVVAATAAEGRARGKVKKRKRATITRAEQIASWEYLIDKLAADGVSRRRAVAAFGDSRVGPFTGLNFSIRSRERSAMYRGFLRSASIAEARRCRALHESEFLAAEARFDVPASVLAALLHVETHCGRNTGRSVVFQRVARLAMANEPANLRRNLARHLEDVPAAQRDAVAQQVRARARELEGTFYPEVVALFAIEDRIGVDPLAIRGSASGAFGLPQFLPSSYLRFAVDGDGDRRVSLYDPADAIASAANYLARHGWRPGINYGAQRQVIWTYNHSDPYIDTVLTLAERLERTQPSQLSVAER